MKNQFLFITVFCFATLVSCADFKFRLSNGNQDFALKKTKYKVNKHTWLNHAYMDHGDLPSFKEYMASLGHTLKVWGRPISWATCVQLECLRDKVIKAFIATKRKPCVLFDYKYRKREIERALSWIFRKYPLMTKLICGFVFPTVNFWAAGDDMDVDTPLMSVKFHDVDNFLDSYIGRLDVANGRLMYAFGHCTRGQSPFGLSEKIYWILCNDCGEFEALSEVEEEIVKKALTLDLIRWTDEHVRSLFQLEDEMIAATTFTRSKRVLLYKNDHDGVVKRMYLPAKMAKRVCYYSVIQLFYEFKRIIKGPVDYVKKREKFEKFDAVLLPLEILNIIGSLIADQPYVMAHLVCKAFYLNFKNFPRQPRHLPAYFVRSRTTNFFMAAVRTELRKQYTDYALFPKRLMQSMWMELGQKAFDKATSLADEHCPDEIVNKWYNMQLALKAAYKTINSELK